ncbi:hypothetical protein [Parafrankia discariae]|uniref:hypothetical protein n=1 Tax=Parafrankia discariae TaxID=365528 RepID=UPI00037C1C8C|nr:hypothetical protein [Parafrankia discariae]
MDEQGAGSAEDLAAYFLSGEGLRDVGEPPHDHGSGPGDGTSTSTREFDYQGHQVRIETTYRITIDGRPLAGHVEVLPSGAVHYHRFPQYAPSSAVDVVKTVIDTLWEKPPVRDELADTDGPGQPNHEHPDHTGHQDHTGHTGHAGSDHGDHR